jgi:hypothetical protein
MIVVRLTGGLGNQMFQYALGRHLALKNDTDVVVDTTYFEYIPNNNPHFVKREYALDIFSTDIRIFQPMNWEGLPYYSRNLTHRLKHCLKRASKLYRYCGSYEILQEGRPFTFNKHILKSGNNAYLIGYWQNEKYFKDIEQQIKQDFDLKNIWGVDIIQLAHEIENLDSVCLNVRRGDFVNNPVHSFVGTGYISKAVTYIRSNTDIQRIYIFSDDVEWCTENLRLDCPHLFVPHSYAGLKFSSYLYLMTKCRHFIIPNSTFGWWAAWLAENPDKMVIAPKQWVNVPGLDASGIIPNGWITM